MYLLPGHRRPFDPMLSVCPCASFPLSYRGEYIYPGDISEFDCDHGPFLRYAYYSSGSSPLRPDCPPFYDEVLAHFRESRHRFLIVLAAESSDRTPVRPVQPTVLPGQYRRTHRRHCTVNHRFVHSDRAHLLFREFIRGGDESDEEIASSREILLH